MALHVEAYIHAAYPPPLFAPARFRRFTLRWNSRKCKSSKRRSDEWVECQGVQFDAHDAQVQIALSNGQTLHTLSDLTEMLSAGGDWQITWENGEMEASA